jgi:hypothetical protein
VSSSAGIGFNINVPDETTGELTGGQIEMTLDQQITYTLLSSSGA